ncbi:hypothetical protein BH10BAC3_BH10BAC3_05450 [soil metagenome]
MTKTLRKRHLQIWIALAFLLPVGIISGWLVIPNQQNIMLLQSTPVDTLPLVYKSIDKPSYTINLRTDAAHQKWQLQWKNKCVLTVPSAAIYKQSSMEDSTRRQLVGRIEAKGDYIFSVTSDSMPPAHFILYDFIHGQTIDTINF